MNTNSAQQTLYDYIFLKLQGYGIGVIDYKEANDQLTYPFYVVGNVNSNKSKYTMDSFGGALNITVDIWCDNDDRNLHDAVFDYADSVLSDVEDVKGYQIILDEIITNTLTDSEINGRVLLHTVINASYKIY